MSILFINLKDFLRYDIVADRKAVGQFFLLTLPTQEPTSTSKYELYSCNTNSWYVHCDIIYFFF